MQMYLFVTSHLLFTKLKENFASRKFLTTLQGLFKLPDKNNSSLSQIHFLFPINLYCGIHEIPGSSLLSDWNGEHVTKCKPSTQHITETRVVGSMSGI